MPLGIYYINIIELPIKFKKIISRKSSPIHSDRTVLFKIL